MPALPFFLVLLLCVLPTSSRGEDNVGLGTHQEDLLYYQPIGKRGTPSSVRTQISVEPFWVNPKIKAGGYDAHFANTLVLFPAEVMGALAIGTGEVQLTRVRASLLRAYFSRMKPVDIGTYYKDLDRGITDGFDLIGFRYAFLTTEDGSVYLRGGLDMGVVHYQKSVSDSWFARASAVIDGHASTQFITSWLRTGIMGKIRYDSDLSRMSGPGASTMGFVAFMLDRDYHLTARVYSGVDYTHTRDVIGRSPLDFFTGMTLFGTFEKNSQIRR